MDIVSGFVNMSITPVVIEIELKYVDIAERFGGSIIRVHQLK